MAENLATEPPDSALHVSIAALKPGHRARAVLMMTGTVAAAANKLKTGHGRSLWTACLAEREPVSLCLA